MEILTVVLEQLGEGCIVTNAEGKDFLDLSKCRSINKGFKDKWELSFSSSANGKLAKSGKKLVSIVELQTEAERLAKQKYVYLGGGVRVYEDKDFSQSGGGSQPNYNSELPM